MSAPPLDPVDYRVAVRALCDFTARRGDLDSRFTPAPSAQQGMAGHHLMASRRGTGYHRELALEGRHQCLFVRGRADGYDRPRNRLEEFKTYRGDLERMPSNKRELHWAQLKVYGALLCREKNLPDVLLSLVYFDIKTEQETVLEQRSSAAELDAFFVEQCERFIAWAHRELAHRGARDRFLAELKFPFEALRAGQRQLAEAVYRIALRDGALLVQAPTGVGKTLGTLFPVLRAAPKKRLDKVFFLVAKTSGREVALRAMRQLLGSESSPPVRVLELASKESACVFPGRHCDPVECPLAKGFYDRLPAARSTALDTSLLDRETLRQVAATHSVCPYYLTQELARWCDVVVGDYNYFFDHNALLFGLGNDNQWRTGLLIDEAHNLVSRAREMYSGTLSAEILDAALLEAPETVRGPLKRVRQEWGRVTLTQEQVYGVHALIPEGLLGALQRVITLLTDHMAESGASVSTSVLTFYFDALRFCRLAASFGNHSLFDATRVGELSDLCLRNLNPAPFLAPRFAACRATVLFSGTLAPQDFYRRLLGLPEQSAWLNVGSPFVAQQLSVCVERGISTRYRDRAQSLDPIAAVMGRQYALRPGNYLAFFSSFDYLQQALLTFTRRYPRVPTWVQTRGMTVAGRAEFLANFVPENTGIGFAVLGGVFSEGIDLPGERLIGAFIATLGLPQMNPVNIEIERRMQVLFEAGYEYTYLYPGLQKVVQAAGRVIRTLSDRGSVHLMDDRYWGAQVRGLLPEWWHVECR